MVVGSVTSAQHEVRLFQINLLTVQEEFQVIQQCKLLDTSTLTVIMTFYVGCERLHQISTFFLATWIHTLNQAILGKKNEISAYNLLSINQISQTWYQVNVLIKRNNANLITHFIQNLWMIFWLKLSRQCK